MTSNFLDFTPRIEQEMEEGVEMPDRMIGIIMDDQMIGIGMMDSDVAPTIGSERLKMM